MNHYFYCHKTENHWAGSLKSKVNQYIYCHVTERTIYNVLIHYNELELRAFLWAWGPFRMYWFTTSHHITSHMREDHFGCPNSPEWIRLYNTIRDKFLCATVTFTAVYETHCLSAQIHTLRQKHSPWSSLCFMVQFNCNKVIKLLWGKEHEGSKKEMPEIPEGRKTPRKQNTQTMSIGLGVQIN